MLDAKRLQPLKDRIRDTGLKNPLARLHRRCQSAVTDALLPPAEPAGFYHGYFCPDHAVELHFDPATPTQHRCPVDDRVFRGEPFDASWRWFVNHRLSVSAFDMALLGHLTSQDPWRQQALAILLAYAERYPHYPPGPDTGHGRGRATYQSLDESVWLIALTRAWDLVADQATPEQRSCLETDLLRLAAEHIRAEKYHRIHNIECWHNAALAAVGTCLGDDDLIHLATEADFGFYHQLRDGVCADGLWWEGSSSYHFYTLWALTTHAMVATTARPGLCESAKLRQMFRAPMLLAGPQGRLPATNDCWFFSTLQGVVCHGVPLARSFYEIAWAWYGDADFADLLHADATPAFDSAEALLHGTALPPAIAPVPQTDGGHGHPDKLALSLHAAGVPVAVDLGTPGYGIDLNSSWYRQTVSHNTVVIDGHSQPEAEGRLLCFAAPVDGTGTTPEDGSGSPRGS